MPSSRLIRYQYKFNRTRRDIAWYLGLNRSYFKKARGSRILVYHGICKKDHLRFNTIFLAEKIFERQLQLYKEYFNVVSLDDFYSQRFDSNKFNIALTFDDGLANNYHYVLPLLEKYEVPAAFFITGIRDAGYDILWNDFLFMANKYRTEQFDLRKLADKLRYEGFDAKKKMMEEFGSFAKKEEAEYWLQMTKDEIKKMSDNRWATIGSHGYYHNDLGRIPSSDVRDELIRSKQFLEQVTGKKLNALAFPYGSYTRDVVREAHDLGFIQQLATDFLYKEDKNDPVLRERLTVNPYISVIAQLHAIVKGKYE